MTLRGYCLLLALAVFETAGFSQARDLDYYISAALSNSPLINDLKNQAHSATLDSLITVAQRKPKIEGKSQAVFSPYAKNWGYDEVITDGGNYQAVASVSQDLFMKSRNLNAYQAIDYEKQGLNLSVKLTSAELRKTITALYIDAYSSLSDLNFNLSLLELMENENAIARKFAENGIYSKSDYLSALVETEGQKVIVSQLRSQYRSNVLLMNAACGISDTSAVRLETPTVDRVQVLTGNTYLALRQFYIDSLKIINEKEAVGLKYRPFVNWFADAGILSSNPVTVYRHAGFSAGLSLTIPIYDGHQRKTEEDKIALKENSRSRYSETARKEYDQEYARLSEELEGIGKVRDGLEKQLALSDELLRSLRIQLESGLIKMQDYLSAIKNYRNISRSLIFTEIDGWRIRNEINFILTK